MDKLQEKQIQLENTLQDIIDKLQEIEKEVNNNRKEIINLRIQQIKKEIKSD